MSILAPKILDAVLKLLTPKKEEYFTRVEIVLLVSGKYQKQHLYFGLYVFLLSRQVLFFWNVLLIYIIWNVTLTFELIFLYSKVGVFP